jgi:hypothetical protein
MVPLKEFKPLIEKLLKLKRCVDEL